MKKLDLNTFLNLCEKKEESGFKEWGLYPNQEPHQPKNHKESWSNKDYGQQDSARIKNKNDKFSQYMSGELMDEPTNPKGHKSTISGQDNGKADKFDSYFKSFDSEQEPENQKETNWEGEDNKIDNVDSFFKNWDPCEEPENSQLQKKSDSTSKKVSGKKKTHTGEGDES
jgi:hypothetical protein